MPCAKARTSSSTATTGGDSGAETSAHRCACVQLQAPLDAQPASASWRQAPPLRDCAAACTRRCDCNQYQAAPDAASQSSSANWRQLQEAPDAASRTPIANRCQAPLLRVRDYAGTRAAPPLGVRGYAATCTHSCACTQLQSATNGAASQTPSARRQF